MQASLQVCVDMEAVSNASNVTHQEWYLDLQVQKMLCICW